MAATIALGLAAALLFALSAVLQQRAARAIVGADSGSLRTLPGVKRLFGRMLGNWVWLVGWLTNLGGVGVQATALKVGSVATVQPLMASQLLFVLSLASAEQRRWPSRRDWLSVLAVCGGLLLLMRAGASPLTGEPHRRRVMAATVAVICLVLALRQISRHAPPRLASPFVGVAAGLCHALNAIFLKLAVEDAYRGPVAAIVSDWPLYALAVTAVSGMLLVQIAFASGPLPPAIAAMSVTNPMASYVLGIFAFDTPVPRDSGVLAAIGLSGAMVALGVVGLANASSTRTLFDSPVLSARSPSRCESTAASRSSRTPAALRTPRERR